MRCLVERPNDSERRLWHAVLRKLLPHRRLVRHPVCDVRADPRQAEPLGCSSRSSNRTIAADDGETVDTMTAGNLDERVDVAEVDRFGHIGFGKADCEIVTVDDDDPKP